MQGLLGIHENLVAPKFQLFLLVSDLILTCFIFDQYTININVSPACVSQVNYQVFLKKCLTKEPK